MLNGNITPTTICVQNLSSKEQKAGKYRILIYADLQAIYVV